MANDPFYFSFKWRQARAAYLGKNPFCVICRAIGIETRATDVDHIIPIRSMKVDPFDERNFKALCHGHHSGKTATLNQQGRASERDYVVTGLDGYPVSEHTVRIKRRQK